MSTDIGDLYSGFSSCCNAPVYSPADDDMGVCDKCKEWCVRIKDADLEEDLK